MMSQCQKAKDTYEALQKKKEEFVLAYTQFTSGNLDLLELKILKKELEIARNETLETIGAFWYDKREAKRLGLERVEIKGNRSAGKLIEQVINGQIDIS